MRIIDANVGLGHWPFRKLLVETADELHAELARAGIGEALVYSLNAVFYKDVQRGNRELEMLSDAGWARVCAVIDATRPGALEDLRECVEGLGACAVRLFPGYHCYALDAPSVAAFLDDVQDAWPGMPALVTVRLEDERLHHPMARVAVPALEPVAALARRLPQMPIILMGARVGEVGPTIETASVRYDISRMTAQEFLPTALETIAPDRLIFGTNLPLFTPECAVLKVSEADAEPAVKERIFHRNILSCVPFGDRPPHIPG